MNSDMPLRNSFRFKVITLAAVIGVCIALVVNTLHYQQAVDNTLNLAIEGLAGETRLVASQVKRVFIEMENDAFVVARTPPIQGMIRASGHEDVDPLDGSTTELWRTRLETIFKSVMIERPHYTQMRYIGLANNGRELVRVNLTEAGLESVPVSALQEKGGEPYMRALSSIKPGQVFLSEVSYNREHQRVDENSPPTLRVLTPVFSPQGALFGTLVINADYAALLGDILTTTAPRLETFVMDSEGAYQQYRRDGALLPFEFHKAYSKAPPEFIDYFLQSKNDEQYFNDGDYVSYFVRLNIVDDNPASSIGVVLRIPESELFSAVRKTRLYAFYLSAALILFSLVVAILLSHHFVAPLTRMTAMLSDARKNASDLNLPVQRADEIGELARAFKSLLNNLTRSEATRIAYVDASGDGYWDWWIQDDYEYMSPNLWAMLGYSPDEKVHHPSAWQAIIFKEDLAATWRNFELHINTKGKHPYTQEVRFFHKNGAVVTVLRRGKVVEWNEHGEPVRMIGTHTDLTRIKVMSLRLEESERTVRAILDSASDGIITINEDGIVEEFNDAASRIFGYKLEEVVGQNVDRLMPEPHRSQHDTYIRRFINTRESKIIGKGRELEGRTKSGDLFPMELSVSEIQTETRRMFTGIVRDITERKQAEDKLKDSEAFLTLMMNSNPDFIFVKDENLNVVQANEPFTKVVGPIENPSSSRSESEVNVSREELRQFEQMDRTALADGYSESFDNVHFKALGMRTLFTRRIRFHNRENDPFILCISRDVTEREALIAKLEESNKELEDFAYVASHDLKAPLRVIDNISCWLEEDLDSVLDNDSREHMNLLRNRVQRMEKLLDDLLEYSRVGRKQGDAYVEMLSGDALMQDILLLLSPSAGFEISYNPEFKQIEVPRMPLQQILFNLINNAIKHHHRDRGKIEVTVKKMPHELLFKVTDDGPGIDPAYHEKIFDMFQTLKPRDEVEGSGMGLAMVRKHLEIVGGTLNVESEKGHGCTFRFSWPLHAMPVSGGLYAAE